MYTHTSRHMYVYDSVSLCWWQHVAESSSTPTFAALALRRRAPSIFYGRGSPLPLLCCLRPHQIPLIDGSTAWQLRLARRCASCCDMLVCVDTLGRVLRRDGRGVFRCVCRFSRSLGSILLIIYTAASSFATALITRPLCRQQPQSCSRAQRRERCKMSAWSGFGDYVEKLGAPMTGAGDAANFEAMLEKALAAEATAPPATTYETTVCIIGGGVGGAPAARAGDGAARPPSGDRHLDRQDRQSPPN